MTQLRILELAKKAALDNWHREQKRYEQTCSEISKQRADRRWEELEKIEELYFKELQTA